MDNWDVESSGKVCLEGFEIIGWRFEGFPVGCLFFWGGELLVVFFGRFVCCIFVTKRLTTVTGRFG